MLLEDGIMRHNLGIAARTLVKDNYDWAIISKKLFFVYTSILGGRFSSS
ncbi:MAG: hypothetical protein NC828_04060 [Candidatus Omnitrophica bacterium]|nr:hypothetical protein [Candidatus Omnitrophota bacterium]